MSIHYFDDPAPQPAAESRHSKWLYKIGSHVIPVQHSDDVQYLTVAIA